MTAPPTNSQRVPPCSARASRSDSVHHWSDRDNTFAGHGSVNPKLSDELRQYLADQPRLVPVVLVTRGVISAIAVARFIDFRSFHDNGDSHVRQQ